MQKKFLKNLALLVFLNLLVKPFWILGVDRQVQNVVGPEEYGFYFAILNFSFLFFIFLDVGITNFNSRNIAQNNHLLNKHLAGVGTLKMLFGVLYALVIFIVGWLIGYNERQLYLLTWVGFNQFLLSFILYLRSNLSGLLLFKTDSLISILDRTLMIIICGGLLWTSFGRSFFTIEWFVYSQTLAYMVTALIALIAVLNHSGKLRLNWNVPFFLMIIKKSLPFALLVLLMSFYNRIDPVLIERLLPDGIGEEQSGIYAQAFRLLDAGQNFAFLFAVLLLPLFSKMIKEKESIDHLVKLSFSLIITGALIISIVSSFFGEQLMQLMYTPFESETPVDYLNRINESARIFKLLMFSFVAISATYIFGTLLTANNNLKQLNIIASAGLITNLLLNFILIPHFLAFGSAIASLTAQSFTALLQLGFAYYILKLKIDPKMLFGIATIVMLLIALGYILTGFVVIDWRISILIMGLFGLLVAFVFKLVNLKELFAILKSDQI